MEQLEHQSLMALNAGSFKIVESKTAAINLVIKELFGHGALNKSDTVIVPLRSGHFLVHVP